MPAPQRRPVPGVIARLEAAPYRFQFMQAVRLVLIWLRREGVPPERALRHILRFRNSLSLAFPASEIESLSIDLAATPKPGTVTGVQLTPAFMGLLGANGTLPLHYMEWIAAHEYAERDESIRACLDLFSDRTIGLFFRAWTKYRPEHAIDVDGEDPYRPLLLSLGACPAKPRAQTDDVDPDADAMLFYIGLLRQRPMSAAALGCILPDYFGVPIAIEQFVGGWDDIADNRQCRMGGDNATLGHSGALACAHGGTISALRCASGRSARSTSSASCPAPTARAGWRHIGAGRHPRLAIHGARDAQAGRRRALDLVSGRNRASGLASMRASAYPTRRPMSATCYGHRRACLEGLLSIPRQFLSLHSGLLKTAWDEQNEKSGISWCDTGTGCAGR